MRYESQSIPEQYIHACAQPLTMRNRIDIVDPEGYIVYDSESDRVMSSGAKIRIFIHGKRLVHFLNLTTFLCSH